jgi:ATP-dependent DNA helicase RecQ
LRQVLDYAEGTDCRRTIQLGYFGERFGGNCGNCDNCNYPKPVADCTIEAMKFLSCVARCQERFGMNHIIDVLRGSKNQKILQYNHQKLSTYGIGKDKSAEDWRMLGRSLLHQGLLDQTTDGYSVLKLNALSWEVMRRQRTVSIAVTAAPKPDLEDKELRTSEVEILFQRLRLLRKQLADEQSVPPYVVFADSTLKLMAQAQPQTLTEFGKLSGVGSHKLNQYGDKFLAEIKAYSQEHQLPMPTNSVAAIPASGAGSSAIFPSDTQLFTLQLHRQGLSVAEIAQKRNIRPTTIIRHLSDLVEMNQPVDLNQLVPPHRQQKISEALLVVGSHSLNQIREYLGEGYSYDEIRLVRGRWQRENKV